MSFNQLQLVKPSLSLEKQFLEMAEDYIAEYEESITTAFKYASNDFQSYVQKLKNDAAGLNITHDQAPSTLFWLSQNAEKLLGSVKINHNIDSYELKFHIGHIRCEIRPSFRRNGLGYRILQLALTEAKKIGLTNVLLVCNPACIASRKIIEANGGRFASQIVYAIDKPVTRRYWIEL